MLNGAYSGRREEATIREFASDFGVLVLPVDREVAERAAELQRDYRRAGGKGRERRLRTPDALILATGDVDSEVALVIAGDAKWARLPGLRVRVRLLPET